MGLNKSGFVLAACIAWVHPHSMAQEVKKLDIRSVDAPIAIGPYSQGVRFGDTVYLSGQLPIDPTTNQVLSDASIEQQTTRVIENLKAVLAAAGMSLADVVSTQVFLKDMNEFAQMNTIYGSYFNGLAPARATIEVARLPRDVKVEISAIARR